MALVQLYAFGASDVWLVAANKDQPPQPHNLQTYNYSYHISTEDGCIDHECVHTTEQQAFMDNVIDNEPPDNK